MWPVMRWDLRTCLVFKQAATLVDPLRDIG